MSDAPNPPQNDEPLAINDDERREITRLVQRLGRRKPIRAIAESLLDGKPPSSRDFDALFATLHAPSDDWKTRTVAAWALGATPLSSTQSAVSQVTLCRVLSERAATGDGCALGCLAAPIIGIPAFALACLVQRDEELFALLSLIALGSFIVTPALVSDRIQVRLSRARAMAARSLGRLGVAESVGALASAWYGAGAYHHITEEAQRSIRRLLPVLKEEHYGRLGKEAVPHLCSLLEDIQDRQFAVEIIEALGKVGDARAIEPLERIAENDDYHESKRGAAHRALSVLYERRRNEEDAKTLLRASSADDNSGATLLRPAQGAPETNPNQLLRASGNDISP